MPFNRLKFSAKFLIFSTSFVLCLNFEKGGVKTIIINHKLLDWNPVDLIDCRTSRRRMTQTTRPFQIFSNFCHYTLSFRYLTFSRIRLLGFFRKRVIFGLILLLLRLTFYFLGVHLLNDTPLLPLNLSLMLLFLFHFKLTFQSDMIGFVHLERILVQHLFVLSKVFLGVYSRYTRRILNLVFPERLKGGFAPANDLLFHHTCHFSQHRFLLRIVDNGRDRLHILDLSRLFFLQKGVSECGS